MESTLSCKESPSRSMAGSEFFESDPKEDRMGNNALLWDNQGKGKKVRVFYLINSLEMGGAERVVVDLVNGLDPARFEPTVCCLRKSGPCAGRIQRSNVEIIEMGHGRGNDPFLPVRMARMMRARGIDVVHSHGWSPFCEGVLAARQAGG